jgi:hypothetical protein
MTNIAAMIEIRNRYRKQVVGEIKVIYLKEG